MLNEYVLRNGKKLRCGYTTGSCAAAASKAAAMMLFTQNILDKVKIDTPKGIKLSIDIHDIEIKSKCVKCSIIKDSGDDPDVTNGIKVFAKASLSNNKKINIIAGEGIGKVTVRGLSVEPGNPAINPVPMKMILSELKKILPENKGIDIELSIPKGKEIAKRTFNPKLGIKDGISIIGTTGIVEPMSEEALKSSLALELSVMKAKGIKKVIFTPGNYGKEFCKKLYLDDKKIIKISNYIGFMLDNAKGYGIEEILIVGHIGKMVKVAGGIFNTHSKMADARMEILAANCFMIGCKRKIVEKIMRSITTDEAVDYIKKSGYSDVFNFLAEKVSDRSRERIYDNINIGTIIFSNIHGQLGQCKNASNILVNFRK